MDRANSIYISQSRTEENEIQQAEQEEIKYFSCISLNLNLDCSDHLGKTTIVVLHVDAAAKIF